MRTAVLATICSLMPWVTLPAAVSTGCGCTLIGVDHGLTMHLATVPGTYRLEVVADGELLSQRFELTSETFFCDADPCVATGVEWFVVIEAIATDAIEIQARVGHLDADTGPRSVGVRIYRADALVHDSTIVPDYETVTPNGSHCDPEAQVASVDLVVP